jgi:phosphatidylinositol-3,4,5-trisphosphate 3-phosphatase/dual-specificity protein phosphatase PTEN
VSFLERAGDFVDEDSDNCLAVHCKGGKGRTGVFICAWLIYSGFSASAVDAMAGFAGRRTGAAV